MKLPILACLLLVASCTSSGGESPAPGPHLPLSEPVQGAFEAAEVWTLRALDPVPHALRAERGEASPDAELLRGYAVLGTAEVTDGALKARLADHLTRAVEASDGMVAACFDPRHALSCQGPEGSYDVLICFECLQIYVYGDGDERSETALVAVGMAGEFNDIYRGLGLSIAD